MTRGKQPKVTHTRTPRRREPSNSQMPRHRRFTCHPTEATRTHSGKERDRQHARHAAKGTRTQTHTHAAAGLARQTGDFESNIGREDARRADAHPLHADHGHKQRKSEAEAGSRRASRAPPRSPFPAPSLPNRSAGEWRGRPGARCFHSLPPGRSTTRVPAAAQAGAGLENLENHL